MGCLCGSCNLAFGESCGDDKFNPRVIKLKAENKKLLETIGFYANSETYFAIGFLPDKPCGNFMNDFSETHLGKKPGKKARESLNNKEE